jgi:uncharacterized membrane protein HdeD (DUF308 family)
MEDTNTTTAVQPTAPKLNGWSLALGILMVISGIFGIMTPVATTVFSVVFLGWFLIIGGIMQFIGAIIHRKQQNVWLGMFIGILVLLLGILVTTHSVASVFSITLMLGIIFLIDGVVKTFSSVFKRPARWGWILFSGLISILLGLMVLFNLIASSFLLLGTLISIYVLFGGIELIVAYSQSKK